MYCLLRVVSGASSCIYTRLFKYFIVITVIDTVFGKTGVKIKLSPLIKNVRTAKRIFLSGLNTPKLFDISKELNNRIHKNNLDRILTKGNVISLAYYGKQLLYEVSHIEADDDSLIEDGIKNLSLENETSAYSLFRVTEATSWKLFK